MTKPLLRSLLVLTLLLLMPVAAATAQDGGAARRAAGASGLPLPRFASVAAREANVRTGPGAEFPIRWVYGRAGLPVQILEEHEEWRLIEDADGERGWAHSQLLSRRRTVLVRGGTQDLRRRAGPASRVLLRAEAGVVGNLVDCEGDWCRVDIADRRGWLPRDAIWGVLPDEWREGGGG